MLYSNSRFFLVYSDQYPPRIGCCGRMDVAEGGRNVRTDKAANRCKDPTAKACREAYKISSSCQCQCFPCVPGTRPSPSLCCFSFRVRQPYKHQRRRLSLLTYKTWTSQAAFRPTSSRELCIPSSCAHKTRNCRLTRELRESLCCNAESKYSNILCYQQ